MPTKFPGLLPEVLQMLSPMGYHLDDLSACLLPHPRECKSHRGGHCVCPALCCYPNPNRLCDTYKHSMKVWEMSALSFSVHSPLSAPE